GGFQLDARADGRPGRRGGRVEDFERDVAAHPCIAGAIDLAHRSVAENGADLVRSDELTAGQRQHPAVRLLRRAPGPNPLDRRAERVVAAALLRPVRVGRERIWRGRLVAGLWRPDLVEMR